jgi:hypothetical protein
MPTFRIGRGLQAECQLLDRSIPVVKAVDSIGASESANAEQFDDEIVILGDSAANDVPGLEPLHGATLIL